MQIEPAGNEVVAACRAARGNAPMLAVELGELSAHGEAGELLEQQAPLAAAAEAELADKLLVCRLCRRRSGRCARPVRDRS